jgi:hypothetical protein
VEQTSQTRFRFSIRAMMIVVAACALLLAPIIWTYRQQQLLVRAEMIAREHEMLARAQAAEAQARIEAALAERSAESRGGNASPGQQRTTGSAGPSPNGKLWAALSANHVLFPQTEVKNLLVEFTLANDGEAPIDPAVSRSRLVVNGQELKDSGMVQGNDPPDPRFVTLPAGDHLQFVRNLGDLCQSPGTYRISWRGERFQSPEIIVCVLPVKAR